MDPKHQKNYKADLALLDALIASFKDEPEQWEWRRIRSEFAPPNPSQIKRMSPHTGHLTDRTRRALHRAVAVRGVGIDWAGILTRAGVVYRSGSLLRRSELWAAVRPHVPEGLGRNTVYRALEAQGLPTKALPPGPIVFFADLAVEG